MFCAEVSVLSLSQIWSPKENLACNFEHSCSALLGDADFTHICRNMHCGGKDSTQLKKGHLRTICSFAYFIKIHGNYCIIMLITESLAVIAHNEDAELRTFLFYATHSWAISKWEELSISSQTRRQGNYHTGWNQRCRFTGTSPAFHWDMGFPTSAIKSWTCVCIPCGSLYKRNPESRISPTYTCWT